MFFQVGYLLIKLLHRLKKVLCCKYSQHVSANVNYLIVENNSELKYVKNSTLIMFITCRNCQTDQSKAGIFFYFIIFTTQIWNRLQCNLNNDTHQQTRGKLKKGNNLKKYVQSFPVLTNRNKTKYTQNGKTLPSLISMFSLYVLSLGFHSLCGL